MINFRTSILIATRNRSKDLCKTLQSLVTSTIKASIVVYDDASVDNTIEMVKTLFPDVKLICGSIPKGYIYARNLLLNQCNTEFAISLDDDANLVSSDFIDVLERTFDSHLNVSVLAFRVWWGKCLPDNLFFKSSSGIFVQGFVGCGHAWRIADWDLIPNYPEWFGFYGEELFSTYHLFRIKKYVLYCPELFVQHRVDISERKKNNSSWFKRQVYSLSSGWYLFLIFIPWSKLPKIFAYSIHKQFLKILKGDFSVLSILVISFYNQFFNLMNIYHASSRLTHDEYMEFTQLDKAKIFWFPNE